jgi:hypothetical protein
VSIRVQWPFIRDYSTSKNASAFVGLRRDAS